MPETSGEQLARLGTDARHWAEEFLYHLDRKGSEFLNHGTMVSWFASAIEVGRSAGQSQYRSAWSELAGDQGWCDSWLTAHGLDGDATPQEVLAAMGQDYLAHGRSTGQAGTDQREQKRPEPLLGLATTHDLLTELRARGQAENIYPEQGRALAKLVTDLASSLPSVMLTYRTVGL
jgi:hypothetical protein